jgi:hypothetical protein
VIDCSIIVKRGSVSPDTSEDKVHLEELLRRIVRDVYGNHENLEKLAEDFDVGDVGDGSDLAEPMLDHLLKRRHVLVEQDR